MSDFDKDFRVVSLSDSSQFYMRLLCIVLYLYTTAWVPSSSVEVVVTFKL